MGNGGPAAQGHVVKEFNIGNTNIKICDDYCKDKTKEEVGASLERIADIALRAYKSVHNRENTESASGNNKG